MCGLMCCGGWVLADLVLLAAFGEPLDGLPVLVGFCAAWGFRMGQKEQP